LRSAPKQVSRAAQALDEELRSWRTRPLGEYRFVTLDARYEKVRHGGHVRSIALPVAVGVDAEGQAIGHRRQHIPVRGRGALARVPQRVGQARTRGYPHDHQRCSRGAQGRPRGGLSGSPVERCQFHLLQNAAAYVPRVDMRATVAADIKSVFLASGHHEAERLLARIVEPYQESAPCLFISV